MGLILKERPKLTKAKKTRAMTDKRRLKTKKVINCLFTPEPDCEKTLVINDSKTNETFSKN